MRTFWASLLLLLLPATAAADGWTGQITLDVLRVRQDGALLIKAGHNFGFTPSCDSDTWFVIEAANPQRDLFLTVLLSSRPALKLWWTDACAEINPGGETAHIVTMLQR
jgi:hypothetical protein